MKANEGQDRPQWYKDLREKHGLRSIRADIKSEDGGLVEWFGEGYGGFTEGQTPVQGYGMIDGKYWYLRCRYGGCTFSVSDTIDRAIFGDDDSFYWEYYEDYPKEGSGLDIFFGAGYIEGADLEGFINRAIAAWRGREDKNARLV